MLWRDAQPCLDPGHGSQAQSLAELLLLRCQLALPGKPRQTGRAQLRPPGWGQALLQCPHLAPYLQRLSGGLQWPPLQYRIFQHVRGAYHKRSALQPVHGRQCVACHANISQL